MITWLTLSVINKKNLLFTLNWNSELITFFCLLQMIVYTLGVELQVSCSVLIQSLTSEDTAILSLIYFFFQFWLLSCNMFPRETFTICEIATLSRSLRDQLIFVSSVLVFIGQAVHALNPFDNYSGIQFIFIHGWVRCCWSDESDNRQHVLVVRFQNHANRNSPHNNTRYTLSNLDSLINHRRFDSKRKTVLYCHGMSASCSSQMNFEWI